VELPAGYVDSLRDELAPYGFEFQSSTTDVEGIIAVLFEADPESFVRDHPELSIEESYGAQWPPRSLDLWLKFDSGLNPIELSFEVFDLLACASIDADLRDRLNTLADPADHAVAVGQALALAITPADVEDNYFE
jgi:hypothetical protein